MKASFEKGHTLKSFFYSRTSIVLLAVISVFTILSVISIFEKRKEAKTQATIAEKRLLDLQERKETLTKDIAHINDKTGKEELLRDRFHVVAPGEELVVIVDENAKEETAVNTKTEVSFWDTLLNFFTLSN
jgi:hypothetical protein